VERADKTESAAISPSVVGSSPTSSLSWRSLLTGGVSDYRCPMQFEAIDIKEEISRILSKLMINILNS